MLIEVIFQFLLELIRALLVEELSDRVRGGVQLFVAKRYSPTIQRAILGVHRRNRERLLNRLITGLRDEL